MNEACLNLLGKDIGTREGIKFSLKAMDSIRELISGIQSDTGSLFNLEATPGEGASSCPLCGEETEVYSRVVGYLRPVKQWNKGKSAEFDIRKTFKVG